MAGAGVRDILLDGPWQHRDIAANGVRFHVAVGEHFTTPAAGAAAARVRGVLVGLAAPDSRPGRGRIRGGRHGPARLRGERQDPARI